MRKFIYILVVLSFFISCKKASERRCIKATGGETTVQVNLNEDFDTLYLYDAIVYELIQDTVNQIKITGGENLVEHIGTDISNNRLTIRNNNSCNFIRSFKKKIHISIHFKTLNYLHFEGSEPLEAKAPIQSNSLRIRIRDGAGSVSLNLSVGYLETTVSHGHGDFSLTGTAQSAFLSCNTNSFCDARALQTSNSLVVYSNTQGDMLINADQVNLKATLLEAGNIKYIGSPITKDVNRTGEGQLIHI